MNKFQRYIFNILISLDQLINVLFGGSPDETMSSRLERYRASGNYLATKIANGLDWFFLYFFGQKDHCKISLEPDYNHQDDVLK